MKTGTGIWNTALGDNPLIRAIRHEALNQQLEHQLHQIARDTDTTPIVNARATAAGDSRKLRGIPALAHGVGSTCPGTDPLRAVIAAETRAERRNEAA